MIRGKILMMNLLPSMAQAFALLVQEEKQREFKLNNQMFTEGSSMNSFVHANSSGSSNERQQFRTNYSSNSNSNGKSRPFYDYCKKLGHTKDKCFKIYGYPQFNSNGNVHNNNNQNKYGNGQNRRSSVDNNQSHNQLDRSAKGKGVAANAFSKAPDLLRINIINFSVCCNTTN